MTRARIPSSLSYASLAAVGALLTAAGCSGGQFAVGQESDGGGSGANSGSSGSSAGSASGSGSGSASGSTSGSTTGSASGSTSGSLSGSASGSASGSTSGSGGVDAGTCCPSGWQSHSCVYPDGGEGTACHDPAMGCASSLTCGVGCDPVATGSCSAPIDAGPPLRWWASCGYPVCAAPTEGDASGSLPSDGGAACHAIGSTCSTAGDTCGTKSASNCGVIEECSATDPTKGPGGCPISSRKFKDDIRYVDEPELEMLHDEALHIRLATYNYKSQFEDPNPRHLGFIVEDDPRSPAVERSFDRVDMYGYVSMVVATMQVQEKEIAELRRELAESRAGVCAAPTAHGQGDTR
jgi:hypothetical protein